MVQWLVQISISGPDKVSGPSCTDLYQNARVPIIPIHLAASSCHMNGKILYESADGNLGWLDWVYQTDQMGTKQ